MNNKVTTTISVRIADVPQFQHLLKTLADNIDQLPWQVVEALQQFTKDDDEDNK